jgi:hypothetical protein
MTSAQSCSYCEEGVKVAEEHRNGASPRVEERERWWCAVEDGAVKKEVFSNTGQSLHCQLSFPLDRLD